MRILAALALVLIASPAVAADIFRVGADVYLTGDIGERDLARFLGVTAPMSKATINLASHGGEVDEALRIGRAIRQRGYSTYVGTAPCNSACALIWLAGAERRLWPTAKLGFHSAWHDDGQRSDASNARIAEYLDELGIPSGLRVWMTTADPRAMGVMTRSDAVEWGLIGRGLLPSWFMP